MTDGVVWGVYGSMWYSALFFFVKISDGWGKIHFFYIFALFER